MTVLRQSTARTILVGPILDSSGAAKTDEVVGNVRATKNGTVGTLDGSATLTHDHAGKYKLALTANDTDTVGVLQISLTSGTNDMPVVHTNVVEEAIFDAIFAASAAGYATAANVSAVETDTQDIQSRLPAALTGDGNIKADTLRVGGTLQTAGDIIGDTNDIQSEMAKVPKSDSSVVWNATALAAIETQVTDAIVAIGLDHLVYAQGTAYASTSTTFSTVDSIGGTFLLGSRVTFVTGSAAGQTRVITGFDSIETYTVDRSWGANPANGDTFVIFSDSLPALNLFLKVQGVVLADSVTGMATATELAKVPKSDGSVSWNATALAAIETQVTDVVGAAGASLTAIPWNPAWDAEVQSEVDDAIIVKGLDHLVFASVTGTDIADNSIIARLASKSATADWDSFTNTTDSLEAIRDRGDEAWITGSSGTGAGARTVTVTVTDSGATPIQNARVRLTSGATSYSVLTNVSGVIVFNLDDATWTVAITAVGYSFSGTTLIVDGTETPTYVMTTNSVPTPSDPTLSTGSLYCYNTAGAIEAGVIIRFELTTGLGTAGRALDRGAYLLTSDANGLVQGTFIRGAIYRGRRGTTGIWYTFTVPNTGTFNLPEILGAP